MYYVMFVMKGTRDKNGHMPIRVAVLTSDAGTVEKFYDADLETIQARLKECVADGHEIKSYTGMLETAIRTFAKPGRTRGQATMHSVLLGL